MTKDSIICNGMKFQNGIHEQLFLQKKDIIKQHICLHKIKLLPKDPRPQLSWKKMPRKQFWYVRVRLNHTSKGQTVNVGDVTSSYCTNGIRIFGKRQTKQTKERNYKFLPLQTKLSLSRSFCFMSIVTNP